MSIRMLDYMIQDNQLWDSFLAAGLDKRDLIFIKEAIYGKPLPGTIEFEGRSKSKFFLYQVCIALKIQNHFWIRMHH